MHEHKPATTKSWSIPTICNDIFCGMVRYSVVLTEADLRG